VVRIRHADRGSALLLTLIGAAVVGTCAVVALGAGDLVVHRQHLEHSADAAARAAATSLDADPCPVAERVARANSATVTICRLDGDDVVVTVVASAPSLVHRIAGRLGQRVPPITATSRAGPG
jgi:secretion/DNA translocation related TadE-like protein